MAAMITKRSFLGALAGAAVMAAVSQANAYPMFFHSVTLNGTPLETAGGFTDPALTGNIGDLFTIGFGVINKGNPSPWWGTVTLEFAAGPGSTLAIADWSLAYPWLPTSGAYTFSFATAGIFDGAVTVDVAESIPDYDLPATGVDVDTRTFPFYIEILAPTVTVDPEPIPSIAEPSVLALFGLALAGIGAMRRRKSA
jgi:hypothetical protein